MALSAHFLGIKKELGGCHVCGSGRSPVSSCIPESDPLPWLWGIWHSLKPCCWNGIPCCLPGGLDKLNASLLHSCFGLLCLHAPKLVLLPAKNDLLISRTQETEALHFIRKGSAAVASDFEGVPLMPGQVCNLTMNSIIAI